MTSPEPPTVLSWERRAKVIELLRVRGTVRVRELAGELGVSAVTVRRDISLLAAQGLARRIWGGAAIIAAEPHDSATPVADGQPLRRSRSGVDQPTLGLMVPSMEYYWPEVIKAAREAAAEANVRIVVRGATYEAGDQRRQLAALIDVVGVDGLLVALTNTGDDGLDLERWLLSSNVPVVLVERMTSARHNDQAEFVMSDHARGVATAVQHLVDLGHRRVGVSTTIGSPNAPHIRQGWHEACDQLGLPIDGTPELCTVDRWAPTWPAALDAMLDTCLDSGTTAMVVHSDPEAISLVERCQERGIRVPEDLAVVTYDDEWAELSDPPLTAIRPPKAAVGRAAVTLLADRLRDPDPHRHVHRITIEPRLIVRSSS